MCVGVVVVVGGWGWGWGWGLKTAEILLAESCNEQASLSLNLNSGRVEDFLRSNYREFQIEGARKLKERSPNISVLRFGTLRSFSHDERRLRVGSYAHRVFER